MHRNTPIWAIVLILTALVSATVQAAPGPPRYASFQSDAQGWTVFNESVPSTSAQLSYVPTGGVLNGGFIKTEDLENGFTYFKAPPSWVGDYRSGVLSFFLKNLNSGNPDRYPSALGQPLVMLMNTAGDKIYYSPNSIGAGSNWTLNIALIQPTEFWCFSNLNPFAPSGAAPCPQADSAIGATARAEAIFRDIKSVHILADWAWGHSGKLGTLEYPPCPVGIDSSKNCDHDVTGLDEVRLMPSSPFANKAIIYQRLSSLRMGVTDRWKGDKLDAALRSLELALNSAYWVDENHLKLGTGGSVFDNERNAVTYLVQIIDYDKKAQDRPVYQQIVADLVAVDRSLAMIAIDEARAKGADVSRAMQEFDAGDIQVQRSKHESAIEHYKAAWSLAVVL